MDQCITWEQRLEIATRKAGVYPKASISFGLFPLQLVIEVSEKRIQLRGKVDVAVLRPGLTGFAGVCCVRLFVACYETALDAFAVRASLALCLETLGSRC